MAVERRSFDRVTERIGNLCGLILSVTAVVGALVASAWALYAVPDIDSRINARVETVERSSAARFADIERSLDYNGAQHRAMMTPAQIIKAEQIYSQMRRQRGILQ